MKKSMLFGIWTIIWCLCFVEGIKTGVEEVYYWRDVIYEDLPLDDDTLIGPYPYHIPANNDVVALEYHVQSGLMLANVGRFRPGIPSSLNAFCVADYDKGTSPHLWGFPDYEKNTIKASFYETATVISRKLGKKEKYSAGYLNHFYESNSREDDFTIMTAYRTTVDDYCNRLYVVDTGALYYGPNLIYYVQNPAVIVFELPSNGCESRRFPLVRRVEIPSHLWKTQQGYLYITVDHQPKGSCDDVFLYITNCFDNSITVYDYKRGSFWLFADASMNPIIAESRLLFAPDYYYNWPLGIMNIALGYPDKYGNRNAYYAPGASIGQYAVSTKLLMNSKRAPFKYDSDEFSLIGYRGCDSQPMIEVIDLSTGVMFFGEMQSKKLRCWNIKNPINPDTIDVVFESDALRYICHIDLDADGYLWFHSCKIPITFTSSIPLDTTDINSRTFRVKASEIIKGTVCDPSVSIV